MACLVRDVPKRYKIPDKTLLAAMLQAVYIFSFNASYPFQFIIPRFVGTIKVILRTILLTQHDVEVDRRLHPCKGGIFPFPGYCIYYLHDMSLLSASAFVARTAFIFNGSNASNSLNNKYEPGNVVPAENFMLTGKKSSLCSYRLPYEVMLLLMLTQRKMMTTNGRFSRDQQKGLIHEIFLFYSKLGSSNFT